MSERVSLFATVHGRVQGVYFRDFVEKHAREMGLAGYVKNLRSGRALEVLAEGEKKKLDELLNYLKSGPARARVEWVDVEWSEYSGSFSRFEVKH